jgi:hypothetical protein
VSFEHLSSAHVCVSGDFPLTATYDLNSGKGVKGLQKWLTVNKLPLLGMINSKNHQSFYESGLPLLWIFTQANEEADVLFFVTLRIRISRDNSVGLR